MGWKDFILKPDPDKEAPSASPTSDSSGELPRVPPRSSQRSIPLPMGPSASVFERTTGVSLSASAGGVTRGVDKESDEIISGALDQDSKEPGYKEFLAQYNALSAVIVDTRTRAQAALATVSASNPKINTTQIVKSFGERLKLLSGYVISYENDASTHQEARSRSISEAVAQEERSIQELDAEIARLQNEKTERVRKLDTLQTQRAGIAQEFESNIVRFKATVDARSDDLKKIMNLITPSS